MVGWATSPSTAKATDVRSRSCAANAILLNCCRASESRGQLGVREVPEPGESQWQAAARSPLRKVSPLLLARCLRLAPSQRSLKGEMMREQKGYIFHKGKSWFVRYCDDVLQADGTIKRKLVCKKLDVPYCDEYRTVRSVK